MSDAKPCYLCSKFGHTTMTHHYCKSCQKPACPNGHKHLRPGKNRVWYCLGCAAEKKAA